MYNTVVQYFYKLYIIHISYSFINFIPCAVHLCTYLETSERCLWETKRDWNKDLWVLDDNLYQEPGASWGTCWGGFDRSARASGNFHSSVSALALGVCKFLHVPLSIESHLPAAFWFSRLWTSLVSKIHWGMRFVFQGLLPRAGISNVGLKALTPLGGPPGFWYPLLVWGHPPNNVLQYYICVCLNPLTIQNPNILYSSLSWSLTNTVHWQSIQIFSFRWFSLFSCTQNMAVLYYFTPRVKPD